MRRTVRSVWLSRCFHFRHVTVNRYVQSIRAKIFLFSESPSCPSQTWYWLQVIPIRFANFLIVTVSNLILLGSGLRGAIAIYTSYQYSPRVVGVWSDQLVNCDNFANEFSTNISTSCNKLLCEFSISFSKHTYKLSILQRNSTALDSRWAYCVLIVSSQSKACPFHTILQLRFDLCCVVLILKLWNIMGSFQLF